MLGAAEGFLRVEPLGGLSFLSDNIRNEKRRDRHFAENDALLRCVESLERGAVGSNLRHRNPDIHEFNNAAVLQHLAHTAS